MFDKISPLVRSNDSIFYEAPEKLSIDEDAKTQYSTSMKVDTLIEELKQKGPLVGLGPMGPKCYDSEPFQLEDKLGGKAIFGWKPGTRSKSTRNTHAIIVGARKVEDKEYVYFRLSNDFTADRKTYIREHRPTSDDSRIYVSSHKTFSDYLVDLYPPVVNEKTHPNFVSAGSTHCSLAELEYVIKLVSIMPLDSILGEKESECKAMGQEIFNKFKKDNNENTSAGQAAVVNICDAIKFCAKDGHLRKQYIERAWDGIGDKVWQWRS